MRKALRRMLSSEPDVRVVGDASNGADGVDMVKRLKPDLVTLDVQMPGMDGLEALEKIMTECPVKVLMVSSVTNDGGEVTVKALSAGAVDFIDKSSCSSTMDIGQLAGSLIEKVKIIHQVDLNKIIRARAAGIPAKRSMAVSKAVRQPLPKTPPAPITPAPAARVCEPAAPKAARPYAGKPSHLVLIGASTGGPMSLEKVLTRVPAGYPGAILVVQHMPPGFTRSLAERMNLQCPLAVKEAETDDIIGPGRIYIGKSGTHLKVRFDGANYRTYLSKTPRDAQHAPSIDVMMESVAQTWKGKTLGVILTGMGNDGARGARLLKSRGARIVAQDEATCVVYGMPKAVVAAGCVDKVLPLEEMADEIMRYSRINDYLATGARVS